jgi:hypothetical protein
MEFDKNTIKDTTEKMQLSVHAEKKLTLWEQTLENRNSQLKSIVKACGL